MIYHFVKNVGFDVEADSLEQATDFINDIDNFEDCIIENVEDTINNMGDFEVDYDVHVGYPEYVGTTEDEDENDPEERLYDYLTEDVRYVLTDKGHDYLDYLNGEYPEYDEKNYDEHGKRIKVDDEDEADTGNLDDEVEEFLRNFLYGAMHKILFS